MYLTSFSQWLGDVTQPHHLLYHPMQASLFACFTYIGTACLTTIPPGRSAALATLTYIISQCVTPLFIKFFEPYRDVPLAPLIGQVSQLAASLFLAKLTCKLAGQNLSFKETGLITTAFIISHFVTRFALSKYRQAIAVNEY